MAAFFNSTDAEQVVRQVATIIGVDEETVNKICSRMDEEFVQQEWQLAALDASEWKALGAPIGLAAAIRKLASVDDSNPSGRRESKSAATPALLSSRSPYAQQLTDATKGAREETAHYEPNVFKPTKLKSVSEDDDDDSKIETGSAAKLHELPKTPRSMFAILYDNHREMWRAFHSMTFPMSHTFNRALLHSKTGDDLKAHTVFSIEIGVVSAALLLGASIEMWGSFPQV